VSKDELKGTGEVSSNSLPSLSLVKKRFAGKYAITAEEFTNEMVSASNKLVCIIAIALFLFHYCNKKFADNSEIINDYIMFAS